MSNYSTLKSAIQQVIKQNGNNEITGNILQQSLVSMINSLGAGFQYMGVATPSTNPGTPDQNVFYIAATAGAYSNFGSIVLADGEVAILKGSGSSWIKDTTGIASHSEVSQLEQQLYKFRSLALLSDADSSANVYIQGNGSTASSQYWTTWAFRRKQGFNRVYAHVYNENTEGLAISFYRGEDTTASTFISGVPLLAGENDYYADIPDGCTFILVSSRTASGNNTVIYITSENTAYKDASLAVEMYIQNNILYAGGDLSEIAEVRHFYIRGDKVPINSASWTAYIIPVNYIRKIRYRTYSSLSSAYPYYAIAFFSDSEIIASNLISGQQFTQEYFSGTFSEVSIPVDAKFAVICCRNADGVASMTGYYNVANMAKDMSEMEEVESDEDYDSVGNPDFWMQGVDVFSDMTWVGDTLVGFTAQAGESQDPTMETPGRIWLYTFPNGLEGAPVIRECFHQFGHCNTVDYNKFNDCLILGNGSGSYTLTGDIIVIPNFSTIVNNAQELDSFSLSSVNALVIHCSSDLGAKFNLLWGDDNDKNYNVAYLITANYGGSTSANGGDLETIRKIVLRKGDTVGQYGTIVENDTPFNGTFDIVETYHQTTEGYPNCIQGGCYHNGKIYANIGHDGFWLWEMRLSRIDYAIYRKNRKQTTYYPNKPTNYGNSTGMCYRDGYFFVGRAGLGCMAFHCDF